MEDAYYNDIEYDIEHDVLSMWLNAYSPEDSDEYKIIDLSKRFNIAIDTVITYLKTELNTAYLSS